MTIEDFYEKMQTRTLEVGALCRDVRDDDPVFWLNYGMASAFSKAEYNSARELRQALADARARRRERTQWGDWRKARYYAGLVKGLVEVRRIRENVVGLDEHITAMIEKSLGRAPTEGPRPGLPAHSVG